MGCCGAVPVNEISIFYTLELYTIKQTNSNYNYKFQLIASEKIEKQQKTSLKDDINECNNENISEITSNENIFNNSLYYLYLEKNPIYKSSKTISNIYPYNHPSLVKIIIVLIKEALNNNISKEVIKQGIDNLNTFPKGILNLEKINEKFEKSQNPNITKDNLNLSDDSSSENEDKLIIEENITENTLKEIFKYLFQNIEKLNTKFDNSVNVSIDSNFENEENGTENNKIKKIIIQNSKFPDMYVFALLFKNLEKYKSLQKFAFNNNFINSDFEGWKNIESLLNKNYNIRILDLSSSTLNDLELEGIIESIKDKRIRLLNLSENFLTVEGMKRLSNFLKINKTLQRLYLQRNAVVQFKAEGVKYVCENLLNHPNILLLDFSFMELTGCGQFIGKLIKENKTLENLNIASCKLNIVDFKNICEPICNDKKLKKFNISFNDMGGNKSLEEIGKIIIFNKSINEIHLDQMNLNMDNYNIILDAIKKNKTIKYYSLSYNYNLNPKIVLKFFLEKNDVDCLEYIPYNQETHLGKEFTLEEKKILERLKIEKPKLKIITK